MNTKDTWLYKNFSTPISDADRNGLIIAFDPTRENAILHQQTLALSEQTGFDKRVVAKADTSTNLLGEAKHAYDEGYEHIMILTNEERLTEVNRFMQLKCNTAFNTVKVVAEHGFRLFEVDDPNLAQAPQQEVPQEAPPAPAEVQGAYSALIFLQANPPVRGFGNTLAEVDQLMKQFPDTKIVIHGSNIKGKLIDPLVRHSLMFTGEIGPALYGPNGMSGIKTQSYAINKQVIPILDKRGMDQLATKVDPNATTLIAPPQMIPILQQLFPNSQPTLFKSLNAGDVDTEEDSHQKLIMMGAEIAKASLKPDAKPEKEDEKATKDQKEEDTAEQELSQSDRTALALIRICQMTIDGKKISQGDMKGFWDRIAQRDKDVLDQVAADTGIGDAIDVGKSVAGLVTGKVDNSTGDNKTAISDLGKNNSSDGEPEVDKAAEDAKKKEDEAKKTAKMKDNEQLGMDVDKVIKHPKFAEFKGAFDLPN